MNKLLMINTLCALALSLSSSLVQAGNEGDDNYNVYYGNGAGANLPNGDPFTSGDSNAFFGFQAGNQTTGGNSNTFSGYQAGFFNTTGSENTFSGDRAGRSNTTGSANTFSGKFAGLNSATGSQNVFLGYTAGFDETSSNRLYIESEFASRTTPLIYGEFDNDIVGINGTLGVGTQLPTATLHVRRVDGTARLLVEENSVTVSGRTLLEISNNGNTKLSINNTSAGVVWVLNNSGNAFRISRPGSGAPEFKLTNSGNLTIHGTLTELSSRAAKHRITSLNPEQILSRVLTLPIKEWSYKDSQASIRHVGPMAEDFHRAFGLGGNAIGIATLDTSGVALAAIQGLKAKQDKAIAKLKMETDKKLKALTAEKDTTIQAIKQENNSKIAALQTQLTQLRDIVQQLIAKDQWVSAD